MKISVIGGENLVPLGKIRVRDSTFNTSGVAQLKEPGNHRILRWLFTLKSFGLDTSSEDIATTQLYSIMEPRRYQDFAAMRLISKYN